MIAISRADYIQYGCPNCGCNSGYLGSFYGDGTFPTTCRECKHEFVVLADGVTQSAFGFAIDPSDTSETAEYEYPKLSTHPRIGIPFHKWVQPDIRPSYGEYWEPRGIGYDLSGFVKSKQAGERLLKMVKEVLEIDSPESWLDYREREPEWIQFKFQNSEFDLVKLMDMVNKNNKIITKEIMVACKLGALYKYRMGIYKYFTDYEEFEVEAYSKAGAIYKAKEYVNSCDKYDAEYYNKDDIRCIRKLGKVEVN